MERSEGNRDPPRRQIAGFSLQGAKNRPRDSRCAHASLAELPPASRCPPVRAQPSPAQAHRLGSAPHRTAPRPRRPPGPRAGPAALPAPAAPAALTHSALRPPAGSAGTSCPAPAAGSGRRSRPCCAERRGGAGRAAAGHGTRHRPPAARGSLGLVVPSRPGRAGVGLAVLASCVYKTAAAKEERVSHHRGYSSAGGAPPERWDTGKPVWWISQIWGGALRESKPGSEEGWIRLWGRSDPALKESKPGSEEGRTRLWGRSDPAVKESKPGSSPVCAAEAEQAAAHRSPQSPVLYPPGGAVTLLDWSISSYTSWALSEHCQLKKKGIILFPMLAKKKWNKAPSCHVKRYPLIRKRTEEL